MFLQFRIMTKMLISICSVAFLSFVVTITIVAVKAPDASLLLFSIITTGIISMGALIIVVYFLARKISNDLKNVISFAKKIIEGDLSETLVVNNKDEIGEMSSLLNEMLLKQQQLVQLSHLRHLNSPIFQIDTDFNITYVNEAASKMMQKSSLECMGKKCYNLMKTNHCQSEKCASIMAMKKKQNICSETRANPNGTSDIPISYTSIPLINKGKVAGVIEFIVDQSDIYNIIEEVKSLVEELNQALSQLSNNSKNMLEISTEMSRTSSITANSAGSTVEDVCDVATVAERSNNEVAGIFQMFEDINAAVINLVELANKTSGNVGNMAESGKQMSENIENVATSVEEMTSSLAQVSKNTTKASNISKEANKQTEGINAKMDTLVSASKQIGKVISVIKDIADQTNMLALNAAIEAAGAGEAGKGFAVVAGEVKELAKQSADATDEISGQIENIQTSTQDAVEAIQKINAIIDEIVSINETIAMSVNHQNSTASDIAKTIAETAIGSKEVAGNADESYKLSQEIVKYTDTISQTVEKSLVNVRNFSTESDEIATSSSTVAVSVTKIFDMIRKINESATKASSWAKETNQSTGGLAQITVDLLETVQKFKL